MKRHGGVRNLREVVAIDAPDRQLHPGIGGGKGDVKVRHQIGRITDIANAVLRQRVLVKGGNGNGRLHEVRFRPRRRHHDLFNGLAHGRCHGLLFDLSVRRPDAASPKHQAKAQRLSQRAGPEKRRNRSVIHRFHVYSPAPNWTSSKR